MRLDSRRARCASTTLPRSTACRKNDRLPADRPGSVGTLARGDGSFRHGEGDPSRGENRGDAQRVIGRTRLMSLLSMLLEAIELALPTSLDPMLLASLGRSAWSR